MARSLFGELGGKYERQGDYLIPCLTVSAEEEQAIGIWGQRHLGYLERHHKVIYANLLTSGGLNAYLADINRQAQERFKRFIEGVKQAQDITGQLKAEDALEWTGCLNNVRACTGEIVEKEIIFVQTDDQWQGEIPPLFLLQFVSLADKGLRNTIRLSIIQGVNKYTARYS